MSRRVGTRFALTVLVGPNVKASEMTVSGISFIASRSARSPLLRLSPSDGCSRSRNIRSTPIAAAPCAVSLVIESASVRRGSGQRLSCVTVLSSIAMIATLPGGAIGPRSRNRQVSAVPSIALIKGASRQIT